MIKGIGYQRSNCPVVITETPAIRVTIRSAKQLGHSKIKVERNSKVVTNAILGASPVLTLIRNLVEDIQSLKRHLEMLDFVIVLT